MTDARDDRWLSVAAIEKDLADRSTLSAAEINELLKSAVTGGHVAIRFGGDAEAQEYRWAEIKDQRYSNSALRRLRQDAANAGPRYHPFNRSRRNAPRQPAPRAALATGYDAFLKDIEARLNLRKVMAFIEAHHGIKFDPLPTAEEDGLDLDAPSPKKRGPKPKYDWHSVETDLLIWLSENGVPQRQADAEEWVADWFAKNGGKVPAESDIRMVVSKMIERYKEHLNRLPSKAAN